MRTGHRERLKPGVLAADAPHMAFLGLLCIGFVAVLWARRLNSPIMLEDDEAPVLAGLPIADRPPATAVGWPPLGARFEAYVDEGCAAIDTYLSEGSAP
jgi:hypothetical protein